jgi:hypothetical protein
MRSEVLLVGQCRQEALQTPVVPKLTQRSRSRLGAGASGKKKSSRDAVPADTATIVMNRARVVVQFADT